MYELKIGNDGEHYAVFKNTVEREIYDEANPNHFNGCLIACFGQYDNAYKLNSDWFHRSGRTKAGNCIG